MRKLFSHVSERVIASLRATLANPLDVLHRYYWSSPWLETKSDVRCEGCR